VDHYALEAVDKGGCAVVQGRLYPQVLREGDPVPQFLIP
jgi:hypothetical protein